MIDHESGLSIFCQALRADVASVSEDKAFLTVDTEFVREAYKAPVLCLVQIASENVCDVIDVLSISDFAELKALMLDKSILKVFHGSGQDVDILTRYGIYLENVYDTQLAELAISTDKIASYDALVHKYLNKNLKKLYKISDWTKRPLSPEQEKYALEDVTYLRSVYRKQVKVLKKLNRESWVLEEMNNRLLEYGSPATVDVLSAFNKHIYEMNEESLNMLRELAQWRFDIAKKNDIADNLVIKNDILLSIAKNGMNRVKQMKKSRFIHDKYIKEFLSFAAEVCKKYKLPSKYAPQKNSNVADFLKIVLDYCANKYNINKAFIADNNDISALASDVSFVHNKFYTGWRYEVFGQYIQPAINGTISIKLSNGMLEITNAE